MAEKSEKLLAQSREITGKKVKNLRAQDLVPAVAFGPKLAPTNISLPVKDFTRIFKTAGYNTLVDLEVEGKTMKAIIKEVQINAVKRTYTHVSLYTVAMDQEIEAEIPLEFVGVAPAVKNNIGFLEIPATTLKIKCLPADLPHNIVVDVTKLENIGDAVTVGDLKLDNKLTLVGDINDDTRLALVTEPQKIVETEEVATTAEAGAEGEAAPAAEGEAAEAKAE